MLKIILHGCNGAMGQVITNLVSQYNNMKIVAGVDINTESHTYPVYKNIFDIKENADVIIDFSNINALNDLFDYINKYSIPLVLCTTGLNDEHIDMVNTLSKKVAILKSANMSLGINLISTLIQQATKVLANANFDIEIVEKHHNRKLDAPSGTALLLADSINKSMQNIYNYTFDRSKKHTKRPVNEIGISAIRAGNIVGEHDVLFAGEDEIITISHTAYSRKIFANGALQAAKYISTQSAGLYSMLDVIEHH